MVPLSRRYSIVAFSFLLLSPLISGIVLIICGASKLSDNVAISVPTLCSELTNSYLYLTILVLKYPDLTTLWKSTRWRSPAISCCKGLGRPCDMRTPWSLWSCSHTLTNFLRSIPAAILQISYWIVPAIRI